MLIILLLYTKAIEVDRSIGGPNSARVTCVSGDGNFNLSADGTDKRPAAVLYNIIILCTIQVGILCRGRLSDIRIIYL